MIVFVATVAAGGMSLWWAMCEGWIGWMPRRRRPEHAAPGLIRQIGNEALDAFDSLWYGLRAYGLLILSLALLYVTVVSVIASK